MNDFFNQEEFEDFFRENLQDYESEPSDSLWGKLQHHIPLKPTIGGSLISSVATVFAVVSIGGLLYLSIQKTQIAENQRTLLYNEPSSKIEMTKSQEINSTQKEIYENAALARSTSISLNRQLQEAVSEFSITESQETNKLSSYTTSEKTEQQQAFATLQKNIMILSSLEELLTHSSKIIKEKNVLNIQKASESKSFSATATQKSTKPTLTKLFKKRAHKSNIAVASMNINQKGSLLSQLRSASTPIQEPVQSKVESKPKQKGEWFLELVYSPHIWTSLKAKKEGYQTKQFLGDIHTITNYGVIFTERRKNGWGFEGGFIYGRYNLNHELDETLRFSYLNSFLDENGALTGSYSLNIESPFWKEDRPVNVKYTQIQEPFIEEGDEINLRGYYTQQINNFQVPAGANYQMELNDKLNLVIQGGVAWSFLTVPDGSFSNADLSNKSLEIVQAEKRERLVFESIDAYIGAGLEYHLANEFKIKLAPKYVTTFRNRANNNNQINLSSFQLNMGLSYPLNK